MRSLPIRFAFALAIAACSGPSAPGLDGSAPDGGDATPCDPSPCTTAGRTRCLVEMGAALCVCEPGFHDEAGACVADSECMPGTCAGHGRCESAEGVITCACDDGYVGERCEACDEAAGYLSDGRGGCTRDLCTPTPCFDPERLRCVVEDGAARCECNAGTHEEDGACVPDLMCTSSSCSGHGACDDGDGAVRCTCDPEWEGAACERCAEGFHPDGAGGCTDDACVPSPCTAPNRGVCVASETHEVTCECDPGHHLEGDACLADETCAPSTCGAHGTCSIAAGRAVCACDAGYAGERCEACAADHHDDGAGGCTTDPCTPSPCLDPYRGVCVAMGATATCECDPGYHEDSAGGCTDDPCTPNPCLAGGQACRVVSGAAECYTPACDDGNPCTIDSFTGTACASAPVADGTTCATSLCLVGERCMAGACVLGAPRDCADANPCTRDRCDEVTGCVRTPDDTLVPDDGRACTDDACAGGVASHVADDTACDDGAWCTGVESCAPADASADPRGCVREDVPAPPPASGCVSYGACDEATRSFPPITMPAGSACDDAIACTSTDRCLAGGGCAGTVTADCGSGGPCVTTSAIGASIDVPRARLSGAFTLGGGSFPATSSTDTRDPYLYLVSRNTGARHAIGGPDYRYATGGSYPLHAPSTTYDVSVPAGVYDLVYRRGLYDEASVLRADGSDPIPNGNVVLQRDVVIGAGPRTLDIDVPAARLSGTFTLNGGAFPATSSTDTRDPYLYLVSRDTGARHAIGGPDYRYATGGTYPLYAPSVMYDVSVPAGTYDLVYRRGLYDADDVLRAAGSDPIPNGNVVLRRDVVIAAGPSTLDIDVPAARLTGSFTLDGGAFPSSSSTDTRDPYLYLVSRDTGARHAIGGPDYRYATGGTYPLYAPSVMYDVSVPAGTYDLVYRRGLYDEDTVLRADGSDPIPNGNVVLRRGVVIAAGPSTLDIDVPAARLTGSFTLSGGAFPASSSTDTRDPYLYLVSRDTGARHAIGGPDYRYATGGTYPLYAPSVSYDVRVPAGTYDLVYRRGLYDEDDVLRADGSDPIPNGNVVLRRDVVIGAGPITLDIDVPATRLTGSFTLSGGAFPASSSTDTRDPYVYLLSRDTGARHAIGGPDYRYATGGTYPLYAPSVSYDVRVPAGTYDLVYRRGLYDEASVLRADGSDPIPNGNVVLRRDVVIGAGARTLDVDVPRARLTGTFTLNGGDFPSASSTDTRDPYVYLRSRETGARHAIGGPDYRYATGGTYPLYTPSLTYDVSVPSGTYDLLYRRGLYDEASVLRADGSDPIPNGNVFIGACVAVP